MRMRTKVRGSLCANHMCNFLICPILVEISSSSILFTNSADVTMDKHYGLSPQDQQHFYGKSRTNPFEAENQYFGNPGTREFDNINQNEEEADAEQGLNARNEAERVLAEVENRSNNRDDNSLHSSLFYQANQMRHAGYYHNDDYSFNQVNLSDVPISPRDVGSPPRIREKKAHVRNNLLPGWFAGFSPGRFQNAGGMSSYMISETNIAPSSTEWFSNSPKVTFDSSFNPNGVRKRGAAGHWERLSPSKKVSVGVILVALMCTIMGVAVSETKKNYAARENAALALAMTNSPTPSPTPEPTNIPTLTPTDRPTRTPISRSPVAGNAGLHGKESDGTASPSRNPITTTPTKSPEGKPSNSPSNSPSWAVTEVTQKVQAAPVCTDAAGEFTNHLDNLKTCEWLDKEPGFTDRKNKNCGTQWPDGSIFPVTNLGANCQRTCSLYNGCGLMNARTEEFEYESPLAATSELLCEDQGGTFPNHIGSFKDCDWLDNDKSGHTDRKSKNCGWGPNLITELGWNCPQTCIWYNKIGCWDPTDTTSVAGMSLRASAAGSTTSEEYHSDTACMNGSGAYVNHNGEEETCDWLHTEFRLERNCGYERHDITPLGEKCPWSCKDYNLCSMPEFPFR